MSDQLFTFGELWTNAKGWQCEIGEGCRNRTNRLCFTEEEVIQIMRAVPNGVLEGADGTVTLSGSRVCRYIFRYRLGRAACHQHRLGGGRSLQEIWQNVQLGARARAEMSLDVVSCPGCSQEIGQADTLTFEPLDHHYFWVVCALCGHGWQAHHRDFSRRGSTPLEIKPFTLPHTPVFS